MTGQRKRTGFLARSILHAFHQACDLGEVDVAERLLRVAEMAMGSEIQMTALDRTMIRQRVGSAHERLQAMKDDMN